MTTIQPHTCPPTPLRFGDYSGGQCLGFIGALLLIANTIVFTFGISSGPLYVLTGIGILPIALFEFSLGLWLTFKGFNPSATNALLNEA